LVRVGRLVETVDDAADAPGPLDYRPGVLVGIRREVRAAAAWNVERVRHQLGAGEGHRRDAVDGEDGRGKSSGRRVHIDDELERAVPRWRADRRAQGDRG